MPRRSRVPPLARNVPVLMTPLLFGWMIRGVACVATMRPWLVKVMRALPMLPLPAIVWVTLLVRRSLLL